LLEVKREKETGQGRHFMEGKEGRMEKRKEGKDAHATRDY
jgi:hypothetical protein